MSSSSEYDPILVSYHDSIVRLSNLKTLDNSNWLDDNIITFAIEYLQHESKFAKDNHNLFVFVSPPIVQLLKMSDHLLTEQFLQSMDFLKAKFLILPINNNQRVTAFAGTHWSLLILSIQGINFFLLNFIQLFFSLEKILYHFDSASSSNDSTAQRIQEKFQIFFHQTIPLRNCCCPQQENFFDCGLYVIVFIEEFCRFIYQSCLLNNEKYERIIFEKFMNELNYSITSDYIHQRRYQLKALLESMCIDTKK